MHFAIPAAGISEPATAEQRAACVAELLNAGEGGDSWIAQSGDVRGLPHALRGESQVVVLGAGKTSPIRLAGWLQ